jgi:hypothetical protein
MAPINIKSTSVPDWNASITTSDDFSLKGFEQEICQGFYSIVSMSYKTTKKTRTTAAHHICAKGKRGTSMVQYDGERRF